MQEIISYLSTTPTALYLAVGIFSLCIGSFLNVVIYRTPKMMEQEWRQECQLYLHPDHPPEPRAGPPTHARAGPGRR